MRVIVYLDLDGGVNGAVTGIVGDDTSHFRDGKLYGIRLANGMLGVYAGVFAFGQLDGGLLALYRPSYVIYNSDVQFFFNTLFHVINFSGWSTLYRRANTTDNDCQYEESTRTMLLTQKINNMNNCLITRLTGQLAGIFENWKLGLRLLIPY